MENENTKDREKIKKLIYKYSKKYYGETALSGAFICAFQILDMDILEVLRESLYILKYESSIKEEEINKIINEVMKGG